MNKELRLVKGRVSRAREMMDDAIRETGRSLTSLGMAIHLYATDRDREFLRVSRRVKHGYVRDTRSFLRMTTTGGRLALFDYARDCGIHLVERAKAPNEPELSERGAGHAACAAGLRGAGSVTRGTVRSSAGLGDLGSDSRT